jgi:hypothetical protein
MGRSPRNRAQHTPQNAEAQPWAWLGSRLVDSGGQGSGVACFHFFSPQKQILQKPTLSGEVPRGKQAVGVLVTGTESLGSNLQPASVFQNVCPL